MPETNDDVDSTFGWNIFLGITLFGLFLTLTQCSSNTEERDTIQACAKRGEAYFREIGSWPYLSDGSDAGIVALNRCSNTLTAFSRPEYRPVPKVEKHYPEDSLPACMDRGIEYYRVLGFVDQKDGRPVGNIVFDKCAESLTAY